MADNIILQDNKTLQISYLVRYQQGALTKIDVKDEYITDPLKPKDDYPDISIMTSDPCLKVRHIARNTKNPNR